MVRRTGSEPWSTLRHHRLNGPSTAAAKAIEMVVEAAAAEAVGEVAAVPLAGGTMVSLNVGLDMGLESS